MALKDIFSRNGGFKLVLYFSFVSALVLAAITTVAISIYRTNQTKTLLSISENQNAALARSFSNIIWETHSQYLTTVAKLDGNALRARPETEAIHQQLLKITEGLPVLKVKIFNKDGLTVYSSEASQIGDSKADSTAFIDTMRTAKPASKTSTRETFMSFAGKVQNVELAESYVPILDDAGKIKTVFELYTDITPHVVNMKHNNFIATLMGIAASLIAYLTMLLIVRRADGILKQQHNELSTFSAKLEQRIAERTSELKSAHDSISTLNVELLDKMMKLKDAQEENIKKGKMAQLGQLTATVAHEIRNPLGAIKTAAYLVERKVKDKGLGLEPQLLRISNGINRSEKIITELLDFSRTKAPNYSARSLDTWLANVVEDEARELNATVEIHCDLGQGDATAEFDEDRMRRVIVNLISNAAEAMVGKGNIAASEKMEKQPRISISTRIANGMSEIEVADNGPGISEENLKRILEPLFTTKSFGVGLGLPTIEKVLNDHGGGLKIASVVGEGTIMTAWFPSTQAARAAA